MVFLASLSKEGNGKSNSEITNEKKSFSLLPESILVRKTFIIRLMDLPPSVKLTKRSLLRYFALAFGLISEKESRTFSLAILDGLFHFLFSKNKTPSTLEIKAFLEENYKIKTSEKLIRYHLNKLISLNLLIRKKNLYYFNPSPLAERHDLNEAFNYWIKKDVLQSLDNIQFVLTKLQDVYKS